LLRGCGALNRTLRVKKPWGFFDQFTLNEPSTVKILTVNPHQRLSLQSHRQRQELWVFLDKDLIAEIDGRKTKFSPNEQAFISKGTEHRLINDSDHVARVLEISFGPFDENDIVRHEDDYGRVPSGKTHR